MENQNNKIYKVDINKDVDFYFEKSLGSSTYDFFLLFNELAGFFMFG